MKKEVLEALSDWIIRITNKNAAATPEELEALPKVAEIFFRNYSSSLFSPVKKS